MVINSHLSFFKRFMFLSGITLAGAFIVNVLNYVFTIITGRLLGPTLFGEIATLMGFFIIIAVPAATLTLYIAKETALLKAGNRTEEILTLYRRGTLQAGIIGIIGLILFSICVPFLSEYLKIASVTLFLFSVLIPASLLYSVTQGVFQGYGNFKWFSSTSVASALLKLILAVTVIFLGWGITGIVGVLIVSTLIPYMVSRNKLKKTFSQTSSVPELLHQEFSLNKFLHDFNFIFFITLGLALLFNIDIIIAKHYLDPLEAGHYAALSTLGKTILYACLALVNVMFPMVSASLAQKGDTRVLYTASGMITTISFLIIGVLYLFPYLSVGILFGKEYYSIIPYLVSIGIAMYFLTLINVLANYFIAIQVRYASYILLAGVVLQLLLLTYLPHTISGIIHALLIGLPLVFLVFLGFYLMIEKAKVRMP